MKHVLRTSLGLVALAVGQIAQAALVNPVGVTLNDSTEFYPVGNLIDNSGLSGVVTETNFASITHANASPTTAWVTDDPEPGGGDYYAETPANPIPSITFDLDQTYNLTHVLTWGYHFGAPLGNEAKSITVEFSTDGGSSFPTSANITRSFSAMNTDTQSLGGEFMANAVRFIITDNFFEDAAGGDRVGLGEVKFLADVTGFFGVQIDRSTGVMTINNGSAFNTVISGIDITSGQGLASGNWNSIANNYDADNDGSVDNVNTWLEFAATSSNLAEGTLGNTTLGPGSSVNLGAVWQQSPVEDVRIDFLLEDGTLFSPPVEFVGNGGNSFEVGDLNFDGSVDTADWPIYRDGFREDLSGLTPAGAYQMGDLNGDGQNNVTDFGLFEAAFDLANGAGAFQAMLTAVPEPSSLFMLLALGGILALSRQRRVGGNMSNKFLLVLVTAGLFFSFGILQQPASAALLGHYEFDDPENLGLDSAGGDNNGTALSNDVSSATGRVGAGALAIDGTGIGLELANPATFQPLTTFTIASFISPSFTDPNYGNGSGVGRVFGSLGIDAAGTQFGTNSGYGFGAINNGQLRYTTYGIQDYNQDAGVVTDVWQHIATVVVGGNATFYLNGENVGSIAGGNPAPTENPFHIGASAFFNSDRFIGLIDDLRVYDVALSDAEISALANVGQPQLTLQVNTTTGSAAILNNAGVNFDINQYEILSSGGALNAVGWNSLQDQDFEGSGAPNNTGDGWEELGTPDSGFLGEAFLQGSSLIADLDTINLGNAFDPSVFGVNQDGDLEFNYRTTSGTALNGIVEYVTGGEVLPGDFDGSGAVGNSDLTLLLDNWGATVPPIPAGWTNDLPTAPGVGNDDLTRLLDNWGKSLGGITAVPEPNSLAMLLLAVGIVTLSATWRRKQEGLVMVRQQVPCVSKGLLTLLVVLCSAATAMAAVSNDREYTFGEDGLEGASNGAIIGSNNTDPLVEDTTADSTGPGGAFLDLEQSGDPTYADVGPGGLARPGAASGEFGARFDGDNDYLSGTPLNRPDELALLPCCAGYPIDYSGVTVRGLQAWVYPEAAGLGSEGSPTTYQSIVFDTIFSGGPAITADGKWTQSSSFHVDGASGVGPVPATVDVAAGDTWYHVMHQNYDATASGIPSVVPGTGGARPFTSVLYVNGVAVSANNDNINTGGDGAFTGLLVVGAAEANGDGSVAAFSNHFDGVIDDLEMYVYGSGFGEFDLFADNEWIANEIANTIPGGVLTPGDINKDGTVNGDGSGSPATDDVAAFIANWKFENRLAGAHSEVFVGDWITWESGDLNHDGVTNLLDWHLLKSNHPTPALLDLGALLSGANVPEPTSVALLLIGLAGCGLTSRRR